MLVALALIYWCQLLGWWLRAASENVLAGLASGCFLWLLSAYDGVRCPWLLHDHRFLWLPVAYVAWLPVASNIIDLLLSCVFGHTTSSSANMLPDESIKPSVG